MSLWGPSKPYVDRVVPEDKIDRARKRYAPANTHAFGGSEEHTDLVSKIVTIDDVEFVTPSLVAERFRVDQVKAAYALVGMRKNGRAERVARSTYVIVREWEPKKKTRRATIVDLLRQERRLTPRHVAQHFAISRTVAAQALRDLVRDGTAIRVAFGVYEAA